MFLRRDGDPLSAVFLSARTVPHARKALLLFNWYPGPLFLFLLAAVPPSLCPAHGLRVALSLSLSVYPTPPCITLSFLDPRLRPRHDYERRPERFTWRTPESHEETRNRPTIYLSPAWSGRNPDGNDRRHARPVFTSRARIWRSDSTGFRGWRGWCCRRRTAVVGVRNFPL